MKMSYQNGHYSGTSASEYEDDEPTDEYVEVYSPPTEAVIILLDVDSFEVQVHGLDQGFSPEDLRTKPFVVVNEFGVLTAVNYPAKEFGIKRSKDFNGNYIKKNYRDVNILEIPNHYEKPNSLIAKKASELIYESLRTSVSNLTRGRNLPIVEKASKDEFYVDVTDEVYYRVHKCGEQVPDRSTVFAMMDDCHNETPSYKATGKQFSFRALKVLTDPNIVQKRHETEALLIHGAAIAYQLLQGIMTNTDYVCSAGVSSNKLLAKIGCGLHKPNSVTILPQASLPRVSKKIKIEDIPGLAGKDGEKIKKRFDIRMMFALAYTNRGELIKFCRGENGIKFNQLAIGYDTTKVAEKYLSKSLKCGISFSYKRGGWAIYWILNDICGTDSWK
ncbi:DNA polymerase eta [Orchesella cincta]|uniref:DNA polymerase eta n=1 Tax=Orchesella cincta TaxID=48709 RepID=A0A1D2MDZ6_ORCCI|nr:DNA polymerase eta [Orchesella cincta]